MTAPRRRAIHRDDLDVERVLKRAVAGAPEIEVGWSVLRQEIGDAGWRAGVPEDDRKPNTGPPTETPCIDYADPTGDLALRLNHLADDLDNLNDHWHLVCTSLRAMARIARKHMPLSSAAIPACDISSCDQHVEFTPRGGFLGMEQIAGVWCAKPGVRPLCARHRSIERRAS